jgi:hypothetical protein
MACVNANKPTPDKPPRVTKLMAITIRFTSLIPDGMVADQVELTRVGDIVEPHLTRP